MANPQAENGHVDIANEIAEMLARTYLNSTESRVLWAILRKTYGWKKKMDRISYSQFEEATGINRRHIADALNSLVRRKIITRSGNGYKLEYGIQKDFDLWVLLPIEATSRLNNFKSLPVAATKAIVTRNGNTPLPVEATKSLPVMANTKDNKDTLQKTNDVTRSGKSIEEIAEGLRGQFTDLPFDTELQKFKLYYAESTRKLKRPGLALLNWMLKAREFKQRDRARSKTVSSKGGNGMQSDAELDAIEMKMGIRRAT